MMRSAVMSWLVPMTLGWVVFVVACQDSGVRDVRLDLILRSSCGQSTAAYDISCITSFEVDVIGSQGESILTSPTCTPVANQFSNLDDLVNLSDALTLLSELEPQSNVRIEFRGYYEADQTPCSATAEPQLLLWGSSGTVDLTDTSQQVVTVQFECRPDCDCEEITINPACTVQLETGACAPIQQLFCRRICTDDDDCWGGALSCLAGSPPRCEPPPESAGMCAVCTTNADCDSQLCVENTFNSEKFCALRCPPINSSLPCPSSMSCKKLDGTPFQELP